MRTVPPSRGTGDGRWRILQLAIEADDAGRLDAGCSDPLRDQIVDHRLGTLLGEPLIVAAATDAVGMALYVELDGRTAVRDVGTGIEQR